MASAKNVRRDDLNSRIAGVEEFVGFALRANADRDVTVVLDLLPDTILEIEAPQLDADGQPVLKNDKPVTIRRPMTVAELMAAGTKTATRGVKPAA